MILKPQPQNLKLLLFIFILLLLTGIFLLFYSSVIFQEGNPWPQIKGIVSLNFGNSDVVKLSIGDNKYITKSNHPELIKTFMKDKGYEFSEQMGSGFLFKSTEKKAVAVHRYYSRFYSLWSITESLDDVQTNDDFWLTKTDNKISFQYPEELTTKYISAAEWPPVIRMESGVYSCQVTPLEISSVSDITSQGQVDDRTYCVNVKHEGAAGSVYSSYTYTTVKNGKFITVNFSLRYTNCANYDEAKNQECTKEREAFDVDATVDRIVQSIKPASITNYESCVQAGFPIMKSNPPQCATADGRIFVERKK